MNTVVRYILIGIGSFVTGFIIGSLFDFESDNEDTGTEVQLPEDRPSESITEPKEGYYTYPSEEHSQSTQSSGVTVEYGDSITDYSGMYGSVGESISREHLTTADMKESARTAAEPTCYFVEDNDEYLSLLAMDTVEKIEVCLFALDKVLVVDGLEYEVINHPEEIFKECYGRLWLADADEYRIYNQERGILYTVEVNRDVPWKTFAPYGRMVGHVRE